MAVCGAGCMGFVNVARGLRAIGYTERRPAAGRAGRARHALRVGVLRAAADPAGVRLHARGLVRAGARHPRRRLRQVRADPPGDEGPRARPGDDQGRAAAAQRARRRRRPRRPGGAAARRAPRTRAGPWSPPTPARWRPATAPGRRSPPRTACTASATWPNSRTPWSCSASPAPGGPRVPGSVARGGIAPGQGWRPCTTPGSSAPTSRTWPPRSASRSPLIAAETRQRLAAALDPGLEPGNPLDVWGTGRDTRGRCSPRRCSPSPTTRRRRGRARRRPGPRVRRRRLLPAPPSRPPPPRTSRSPCSPRSPPRSTSEPRPGCARPASRSSSRPAPACSRCGHLLAPRARVPVAHFRIAQFSIAQTQHRPPQLRARPLGAPGSRLGAAAAGADLFDLLRDYGIPAVPRPLSRHPGRGPGRGRRDRLPGRAQDRQARHRAQVRRRRRPPRRAPARRSSPTPTRTSPPASARASPSARWRRPGPELILGMARDPALGPLIVIGAGRRSGRAISPNAPWRCRRSAPTAAARRSPAPLRARSSPASAASRRATCAAVADAIAAFSPWSPTSASTSTPSTSTR